MSDLRGAIKAEYNVFKTAWNELAKTLNGAFAQVTAAKFKDIRLMSLNCEIEKDTLESCCSEIVSVVQDADSKPENLVQDCGLESLLPGDWKEKGVNLSSFDEKTLHEFGTKLSFLRDGATSCVVVFYVARGAYNFLAERVAVETLLAKLGMGAASFLAGAVIGAAVFVITDMIMGAIFGAQERRELNDAIDTLTEIKQHFDTYLGPEQVGKISAVTYMVKNDSYKLDDKYAIEKQPDGTYAIVIYEKKIVTNSLSTVPELNPVRTARVIVSLGKAKAA